MQNKYWANGQWNNLASLSNIGAAASIHKSSHATGGSDALSPSDIGVQDTNVPISTDIATALGLTGNPQVKDALFALYLGPGRQGYDLTFTYSNGQPVQNMKVAGIITVLSGDAYTDSSGHVFGVSTSNTPTVSINYTGYADVDNFSMQLTGEYPVKTQAITVPLKSTKTMNITSSQSIKFSNAVSSFDAVIVGGGGGGGGAFLSHRNSSTGYSGGGGGGGNVNNFSNITPSGTYTITIGAAGAGGIYGYYNSDTNQSAGAGSGGTGGTTTMSGVGSATGGNGGTNAGDGFAGTGGPGNGNGGNGGSTGSNNITGSNGIAGSSGFGGGGGGGYGHSPVQAYSGGSPYGGAGYFYLFNTQTTPWVETIIPATAGVYGGGGGGGGVGSNWGYTPTYDTSGGGGASGGNGVVSLTWRYKVA